MQPGRARTSGLGVPLLPLARWVGWVAPVRPTHGVLVLSCPSAALRVCAVLGRLNPVHRCARAVCCVASAVSCATWLLFTGVLARCVLLRVRCPGPLGSRSPVRPLGVLCCVCGVPGHLAPVHRCARSVCCFACAVSWATWLLFTDVPARCVVLRVRCPGPLGSRSPVRPLGALCCVCGVPGPLAPVHRCARSLCCVACAVSWATWLLFSGVPAGCVVLREPCPGPLGSCPPVCPLGVLRYVCGVRGHLAAVLRCARWVCCCVCGVLGHLAPVHRCACSVCCFACAVSWATWLPVHRCARSVGCAACAVSRATWLLFTGVPARCVVLRVRCPGPPESCSPVRPLGALSCARCPGPLGSCSPVRPLGVLLRVCGVLGPLAPVHRCPHSVCCFACAVSWATWLLFTSVPARCVVLRVRCPGPLDSRSPVCPLGVMFCVCAVLGHLAPVHWCARSVCCVACAVSWAPCLPFTGVPARCVVLRVRCPGPPGSCSPVCPLGVLCCVYGVLGHLAAVHQCACSVLCFARAVSWATWLPFTGVPTPCVVLRVRCPGPLGSCSLVCPLGVLCCVCGVLGHLAPVHRCARSVCVVLRVRCPGPPGSCSPVCPLGVLCCVYGVLGHLAAVHQCACSVLCFARAVSWATWLPFTGVPTPCVVLRVRCPGPLGSCSLVCPLGVLCCVCGVLGHLAPVHRCARSVCVVLRVRCPGPPGSCSPVCPLGVLCCVYGVLGHLAPVHRCARSVLCFACAVSRATWLLFTGVPTPCVVLRVRCPGPLGSCSLVCPLGVLCCVCGVLGPLTPLHRCVRSVCCFACAVSWATWLLFTGVPARCAVLRVRCPGPLDSRSPVCPLGVLFCVCGVLGHLVPVHRCARSVCCVACTVSWATWLLFTGVSASSFALLVWCPGPLGSCSPVSPLCVLFCVCGVLGHLAPVHWCARSVCCVACAVSWAP